MKTNAAMQTERIPKDDIFIILFRSCLKKSHSGGELYRIIVWIRMGLLMFRRAFAVSSDPW